MSTSVKLTNEINKQLSLDTYERMLKSQQHTPTTLTVNQKFIWEILHDNIKCMIKLNFPLIQHQKITKTLT